MRRLLRIVVGIVGLLCTLVAGAIGYALLTWDRSYEAPYPDNRASEDPAVIERGRYLAEGPAHCVDCHVSEEHDAELRAGKVLPPTGGRAFELPLGTFYSPNLTPDPETGIGSLRDEELARAMRHGVAHDGHALLPIMPYQQMSVADMTALISYMRALPPLRNEVPKRRLTFLGKLIFAFVMRPEGPKGEVPRHVEPGSTVAYGKYLAHSIGECYGCHTNRDLQTGAFVGEPFAGGFALPALGKPGLAVVSPNLTSDPETGLLATMSEDGFVARMRSGRGPAGTHMAWACFGRMTEDDDRAIYRYLRTVPPMKNDVGPIFRPLDE